jgi:hypothetical protein
VLDEAYAFWLRGPGRGVFRGGVPASQPVAMRAPLQEGDFPGPVKYGYQQAVWWGYRRKAVRPRSSGGPCSTAPTLRRLPLVVTGESHFEELPGVIARLAAGSLPALCHTTTYNGA